MLISIVLFFVVGLNFGIDFRGGTTIRTESVQPVDVGAYRAAIAPLGLGDVSITEVFDPSFDAPNRTWPRFESKHRAMQGDASIAVETVNAVEAALQQLDPDITFPSVESVGPESVR